MSNIELVGIPISTEGRIDVYSGVARMSGKIWGSLHRADVPSGTVAVIVHPTSNFLGHYLLEPLATQGIDALGLTTRYVGNDSSLLMEQCVIDIGAAVRLMRERGYDHVALIGNSGGGGLAAMYQSQAESPTITATPAGDPPDLTRAKLPAVDALLEVMAHPGRALVAVNWLDPAIEEETDPFNRNPQLDMFDKRNGPPYTEDFLHRYREAQVARNRRITAWVKESLAELKERPEGGVDDLPFTVHGTIADPRFLDTTIDPSDRVAGTLWGPPHRANYNPASLGHQSSLRSWLSQWSIGDSNCNGPKHLARTDLPTMVMTATADQVCFPSDAALLYDSIRHERRELIEIKGGTHYLQDQPDLVLQAATAIVKWLSKATLLP